VPDKSEAQFHQIFGRQARQDCGALARNAAMLLEPKGRRDPSRRPNQRHDGPGEATELPDRADELCRMLDR
jgi:hypothetical protein